MNPYVRRYAPMVRRGMGDVQEAAPPPPAPPVEEEQLLPLSVTLTALQRLPDLGINIDKDGDFYLTHLWGVSTGLYTILLRHHNGRGISATPIRSDNLVGTAAFRTGIKPIYYPAGSRISVDLEDLTNANNAIELIFGGVRRPKTGY